MTSGEYKAWLEGYLEGNKGNQTKKMLDRIAEKAQELSDGCCHTNYPYWFNTPVTVPSDWTSPPIRPQITWAELGVSSY